jgi:hypothetical protein
MQFISFDIMKRFMDVRELNLGDVKKLLPKKFGDHRDWYPIASLISEGYVGSGLTQTKSWEDKPTAAKDIVAQELAIMLHTMTLGPGKVRYQGREIHNGKDFNDETLFATAKADLHFAERSARRFDRIVTTVTGIAVGIITGVVVALFKAQLPSP